MVGVIKITQKNKTERMHEYDSRLQKHTWAIMVVGL